MREKIANRLNTFSARIVLMVLLGIGLIAVTVSIVVLAMSKRAFRETYGSSQENVFNQIEKELNELNNNLHDIVEAIDSSWAFRLYLNGDKEMDNMQTFQIIYQMEKDLEQSKSEGMERLNILVLGMKGNHYLARTEVILSSDEEIFESTAVKTAIENPDIIHYTYSHGAYTTTSRDSDVVIASKALYYPESREIYGIVLVTLTMSDLRKYFDYFVSDNTDFYMVDGNDIVMTSNHTDRIGKVMAEPWYASAKEAEYGRTQVNTKGANYTVMKRELAYLGCCIYGIIDNNLALKNLYNMPLLVLICFVIGIITLTSCLIYTRNTINPLSKLANKMSGLKEGDFSQYMEPEGTLEVQEIASTYNYMLKDLEQYVEKLMQTQKMQRNAEIKALQMQINPHYIYNTLASIKWLVYEGDKEKTAKTIDAFISLLRSTISNMDEFITIDQELKNLENYILINHTRYGEAIKVEYYISHNCHDCLLPKMILQPFVENAFFHAFPSGQNGIIQIFIETEEDNLIIRIVDDGVGMNPEKASEVLTKETEKEHFSGIGVHNVQDRLKLIYGEEYGVEIVSTENEGTEVIITVPIRRAGKDEL